MKALTKTVLETALDQELTEHLGHEKHAPPQPGSGNVRNGTRPKTVLTEATGEVGIDVPRDRAGTFEPQIVRKRQRRLSGVDEMVLSLYAKGLTTGENGFPCCLRTDPSVMAVSGIAGHGVRRPRVVVSHRPADSAPPVLRSPVPRPRRGLDEIDNVVVVAGGTAHCCPV